MKILTAYFSGSGITASAAKEAASAVGADIFEIRPKAPYTSADLNWMDKNSRTTMEMNDEACRPEMADAAPDMSVYDVILLGFPIWWYVEPRIIDTFLESIDLNGKTVIPFATSGGSGIDRALKRLKGLYPEAVWKDGGLLNGRDPAEWAKKACMG